MNELSLNVKPVPDFLVILNRQFIHHGSLRATVPARFFLGLDPRLPVFATGFAWLALMAMIQAGYYRQGRAPVKRDLALI